MHSEYGKVVRWEKIKMKPVLTVVAALLAGFVGGLVGTRVPGWSESGPREVVRARSFELVNQAGQVISYWGIDENQELVLSFGSRGLSSGSALHGRPPLDLRARDNQLVRIGLQGDDMPFLQMSGADGKIRASLLLSPDSKPTLSMADETGPRVSLGIEQSDTPGSDDNDWTLVFGPERARIGMFTEKDGAQKFVRGIFMVNRDKVRYPYAQPK